MVLSIVKAMVTEALQDRMAAVGVAVAALLLLLTAWVLGVAALVLLLARSLGMVGALAAVTAGLVILAFAIVGLTRRRNHETAEQRAKARALWASTAVNAAGALLRRGPKVQTEEVAASESGGSHRSTLLIIGGLALILLAFLLPSGKGDGPAADEPDAEPGPDSSA